MMKRRTQAALEEVGINVPSDDCQELIQRLAYVATLGTTRSYFKSLKAMEKPCRRKSWTNGAVGTSVAEAKLWFHQGVPLFPVGPAVVYLVAFLVVSPVVLAAIALNLPAFVAGWYAGKKFPDGSQCCIALENPGGSAGLCLWVGSVILTLLLLGKFLWLARILGGHMRRGETLLPI
jgi:hypothetical protein